MTPDGKTFDPETVTDKQLVQYEQAIDRGLTEADAMRLTEHEYNGFQANAIIAAALNPAVGEDVLDALATPKYTAAQMTAIAKIADQGRRLRTLPRPADGRTAHGSRLSGRGARWERLACGTSLPLPAAHHQQHPPARPYPL